jgi:uncharacterized membrane protein
MLFCVSSCALDVGAPAGLLSEQTKSFRTQGGWEYTLDEYLFVGKEKLGVLCALCGFVRTLLEILSLWIREEKFSQSSPSTKNAKS